MIRGVLGALWSLRGDPPGAIAPTAPAVRYHTRASRGIAPLADLYLPERAHGPSAVIVHGGAFVIGSRRMKPVRFLAARLARAGVAVCAIDYRMLFRGGRLDEAVDDVVDAFAFWRARAPDPAAISLVGMSAGATLAMLAAARGATPSRLACCYGVYEFDRLAGPLASALPRMLFGTPDRAAWRDRSPRALPQPTVPTLLLHGDADALVPVEQARRLAAHREALGLPTRLVIYPDTPHAFFSTTLPAADAGVAELLAR